MDTLYVARTIALVAGLAGCARVRRFVAAVRDPNPRYPFMTPHRAAVRAPPDAVCLAVHPTCYCAMPECAIGWRVGDRYTLRTSDWRDPPYHATISRDAVEGDPGPVFVRDDTGCDAVCGTRGVRLAPGCHFDGPFCVATMLPRRGRGS